MPYAVSGGFRTYFETHGTGFPLLLINGLGGDHIEWLFQVPAFKPHFKVVVFDNFGSGKSDVPPGPYTTARMADDAARLLETLSIPRAHVLGVSLGGMIAQEVALRHPDRVGRLVLGCTAPGGSLSIRPSEIALAAFQGAGGDDPEADLRRILPFLYSDAYISERSEEIEDLSGGGSRTGPPPQAISPRCPPP
jgi:3-oxoadipate enol-lactonase